LSSITKQNYNLKLPFKTQFKNAANKRFESAILRNVKRLSELSRLRFPCWRRRKRHAGEGWRIFDEIAEQRRWRRRRPERGKRRWRLEGLSSNPTSTEIFYLLNCSFGLLNFVNLKYSGSHLIKKKGISIRGVIISLVFLRSYRVELQVFDLKYVGITPLTRSDSVVLFSSVSEILKSKSRLVNPGLVWSSAPFWPNWRLTRLWLSEKYSCENLNRKTNKVLVIVWREISKFRSSDSKSILQVWLFELSLSSQKNLNSSRLSFPAFEESMFIRPKVIGGQDSTMTKNVIGPMTSHN